jgi:hypothetical protein
MFTNVKGKCLFFNVKKLYFLLELKNLNLKQNSLSLKASWDTVLFTAEHTSTNRTLLKRVRVLNKCVLEKQ